MDEDDDVRVGLTWLGRMVADGMAVWDPGEEEAEEVEPATPSEPPQ